MCKKMLFLLSVVLLLYPAVPVSAINFSSTLLTSYEPSDAGRLTVSTDPCLSPSLVAAWPVRGGVNGVPKATEGNYVLKLEWTNEADRKIEVRHDCNSFTFDLAGHKYIYADVYVATESAMPQIIGIWDDVFGWVSGDCVPRVVNEWYTISMNVSSLNYTGLDHIAALIFEQMGEPNDVNGTIYVDNLMLGSADDICLRKIKFSGYWWSVLQSDYRIGAGPNRFTDNPNDVWVDPNGYLHLSVVNKDPNWYCSEVIANANLGYGTYVFTVKNRVDILDPNLVLGLFTYDVPDSLGNSREIDVELSRWGQIDNDNAQFVVQPWDDPGNMRRFDINYSADTAITTHVFKWKKNRIDFQSYYGNYMEKPPKEYIIQSWSYKGDDVPAAGEENPRINFYLVSGAAPANGQNAEVVIKRFRYIPNTGVKNAVMITPRTLNLASKGNWINCILRLPKGYNIADVNTSSILLEGRIKPEKVVIAGQIVMVKIARSEVQEMLGEAGYVELKVTWELKDGTEFEGTDVIRMIDKGKKNNKNQGNMMMALSQKGGSKK